MFHTLLLAQQSLNLLATMSVLDGNAHLIAVAASLLPPPSCVSS